MTTPVSKKADEGKARWHLMPWTSLHWVLRVLEFGANKYVEDGWMGVEDGKKRYRNALMRHAVELLENPDAVDEDSGLPVAAHIACNALFLLWFREGRLGA